ncbi:penicillin-binding protein 1A [Gottschalkia purinilytica]|uniref:Penicillin-binding protein 1A n=1 Tax=Gottschalkia purinilytica TaxID=1503 RepID=A0A0L0WCP8_GOTPU|nr:transglycosylase domain-containing protein [Gottschalkia purinilytica]KNF09254.1 penicillin-binding protein 1A [Gottschalkia purinilytica]
MTQENNKSPRTEKNKSKKVKKKWGFFRVLSMVILITMIAGTGIVGGLVFGAIRNVPEIDPSNIESLLHQNSTIVDEEGNLIEKLHAEENRTIVDLDKIPKHLQNAFISIEDERFRKHFGVDVKGIMAALIADIKAGAAVRGASTITQQLAKNLYLTNEKKLTRKIKEAYIAIKMERVLTKDQILEAYLNRIYLGQGAYGVQEAAHTYFSKDVSELTLAESTLLAGVTKNPTKLSLYKLVSPNNVSKEDKVVGNVDIYGEKYTAVYNPDVISRQRLILMKMKELGYISEDEHNTALNEDVSKSLKPGAKKFTDISSYFADFVKSQVLDDLVKKAGYTKEQAQKELLTGGLKVYATVDLDLQREVESVYSNFAKNIFSGKRTSSWTVDGRGNIIDTSKSIVYYKKANILDESGSLILENGTYELTDEGLTINNRKLNIYPKSIDIKDYYTLDNRGSLITHTLGSIVLNAKDYRTLSNKEILIKNSFLNKNKDFYKIDGNKNLLINGNYFLNDGAGILQPQSATVVMDHSNGTVKAMVGGRNFEGQKILNRALAPRQPGSSMKPIAAYLPALDNGYTAATSIDDVPFYNGNGKLWPRNWYRGYKGLVSLRESVEQSINVNSVKVVEDVGTSRIKEYLQKMGIIKENESDSFVTKAENRQTNDENLSALGLGGMAKGISPLDMTAAFSSIANEGVYIKPRSYIKVEDRYGNTILDNKPSKTKVVSPQVAYVMTDVLKSTVTSGLGKKAKLDASNSRIPVAGKTGTTSDNTDLWFVGYTPYYSAAVWIGNDSPSVKVASSHSSSSAAQLWSIIMKSAHKKLPAKNFKMPNNIVRRNVCTVSGKLATDLCRQDPRGNVVRSEIFVKGTEPKDYCDMHVRVNIDTVSGMLASDKCPSSLVASRVFIKRNPPYNPSKHGGIVPDDYKYTVPTKTCDHSSHYNKKEDDNNIIDNIIDSIINNGNNDNNGSDNNNNNNNGIDVPGNNTIPNNNNGSNNGNTGGNNNGGTNGNGNSGNGGTGGNNGGGTGGNGSNPDNGNGNGNNGGSEVQIPNDGE